MRETFLGEVITVFGRMLGWGTLGSASQGLRCGLWAMDGHFQYTSYPTRPHSQSMPIAGRAEINNQCNHNQGSLKHE
jgi:hypothetical protein